MISQTFPLGDHETLLVCTQDAELIYCVIQLDGPQVLVNGIEDAVRFSQPHLYVRQCLEASMALHGEVLDWLEELNNPWRVECRPTRNAE